MRISFPPRGEGVGSPVLCPLLHLIPSCRSRLWQLNGAFKSAAPLIPVASTRPVLAPSGAESFPRGDRPVRARSSRDPRDRRSEISCRKRALWASNNPASGTGEKPKRFGRCRMGLSADAWGDSPQKCRCALLAFAARRWRDTRSDKRRERSSPDKLPYVRHVSSRRDLPKLGPEERCPGRSAAIGRSISSSSQGEPGAGASRVSAGPQETRTGRALRRRQGHVVKAGRSVPKRQSTQYQNVHPSPSGTRTPFPILASSRTQSNCFQYQSLSAAFFGRLVLQHPYGLIRLTVRAYWALKYVAYGSLGQSTTHTTRRTLLKNCPLKTPLLAFLGLIADEARGKPAVVTESNKE